MKKNPIKNLLKTAFLLAVVLFHLEGFGQISVTSSTPYTQNFNSYAGSSASLPTGWAASGTFTYRGTGNGSSTTGGAWAYGTTAGQEDLGALASGTSSDIIYSVSFVNNTGSAITSLVISFNFDQWANNGGNTNGFTVSGTGALNTSPINSSLNTNLSTNSCISSCGTLPSSTTKTYTLTGLSIANGTSYGLSWEDLDGTGSDNPIGIDNFSITAIACATPTLSISGTQTICAGQTTTLTASGASTYSWSTGATSASATVSPTSTTVYTVTGTSSGGCTATKTATVTVNSNPTISVAGTQTICSGQTTTLTASGASTYTWSTSATTATVALNPTTTTVYTVTGTNVNGCKGTNNPTITVAYSPTVSISGTQTICIGQTATLTASGASTYTWSTGANTAAVTVTPTTTTVYTVTGSNSSACSTNAKTATVTVTYSASLSTTRTNVSCNGSSTGSINLTTTGGTSPFTYSWTGPSGYTSSTQNISGLAAGSYSVVVTSTGGCNSSTVTTITQPSVALSVQANGSVSSAACNSGAKGSVILVVSGGNTPYSYSWSNGSTSQNQSNLTAGIYSVTVTDANGCTATTSVDFSTIGTKISTFPYTQSFESGSAGWITGALNQTIGGVSNQYVNDWATGVPAKSHITTAGDGSKCWVTGGLTGSFYDFYEKSYVQSPVLDLTNLQYPVLSFMLYRESEYQYDGANVSYSTDGGSTWTVLGAYNDSTDCNTKNWYNYSGINYLGASGNEDGWSGNVEASYTDPNDNTNTCQGGHGSGGWVRVKHCLTGLAGNSCVMLRFNYGAGFKCNNYDGFAFDSVAVSNGIATSPHYTYACSGVNTLSFTASNSSCVKATSWNWNFGDASSGSNTSTSTNPTHVFSQPGTYTVSLSTNGACNPAGTYTSAVTVFGPSISGTQTVCSGQSTTLTASGASTYTWSTGANTASITVTPTTTTSYTVTSNGSGSCVGRSIITVSVNPSFTITTTHTNIACNGSSNGSINLTTTGGTSPFTYSWTGPSGYTASSQNISGLAAGSYSVLVTSATGCTSSTVTTITQPSVALSVQADASVSSAACNSGAKGSIILVVSGGNTPYSYSWSNGSTSQNQSNLTAGIYSVTVTDANGCTATTSVDFSTLGTKIATFPYTQSFESGAAGWITGALNQTISGVPNQYINDWACGAPSKSHITTGGDGSKCWVTGGLTGSFYDFYEKSYVQSPVFDFTGLQYPVLSFKLYRESEYQYDGANVSYSTNGGTTWTVLGAYNDSTDCDTKNWYNYSGITYLGASSPEDGWSGNVEASYTDPSDNTNTCQGGHGSGGWVSVKHCLTGLAGNSCVMLRFNYGAGFKCNNYDGFAFDSVAVGNGITTSPHFTSSCSGVNTLSFTASNSSCIKATSWNWNFGDASSGSNTSTSTNPTHVFTQPGTYTVSLSTNGACNPAGTYTSAVTIFGPSISGTQTVCSGQSTTLTASGASSYTWSTGAHTASITATPTTTTSYTVTGTGSGGCVGSSVITVTVNPSFTITTTHTNIACNGASTGSINLTTTGGTSPFTYSWTGPSGYTSSTQNISGLAAGSYSVLVTSTGGCTSSTVTTITQPSVALSVQANASESNACNTSATGSIILVVSGGNTPYSYSWSNGSTSQNQSSLSAGIYSVSVTDANGCVVTASSDLSSLGTKISTFPYTQSFESGAGGWITGALNQTIGGVSNQYVNDWATGVPTKSHITTAGDGSKCWVTGGLTGSFYDFYEKSYVQSPVLDLTNLQYPVLSFMLYRESEYKYDGANVSYSTNGGSTWTVLGAYNDSTDCNTKNWYNYSGINYLGASGNEDGWSGNVEASYTDPNDNTNTCQGGHGSGGWVRVKHCLTGLAGNSCVMLRFNYGAGFKCNNYDGFAFDSVAVSNGIATSPHYTYACSGVNTLSFTASNSSCVKATSWSWNFGDASSGSNTSTSTNPTHVFSQPGTYTVSLSTNGACNPAGTYTSAVTVFGPSISGTQTVCSGQSTTLTASGASTYTWSTGAHTSTITVSPTTTTIYTVTATSSGGCVGSITPTVTVNATPTVSISGTQTICAGQTTTLTASGATTYSWNTGATTASVTVNPTTTTVYTVTGTTSGCSGAIKTVTITVNTTPTVSIAGTQTICSGQSTTLTASGATTYSWSTGATTASVSLNPITTTVYSVTGTIGSCTSASKTATITVNATPTVSISGTQTICVGQATTLTASGATTYSWNTGDTSAVVSLSPTTTTVYTVTGTTSGCSGPIKTATVIVNSAPTLSVSGTNTICSGQTTTLTASGATTYTWSTGATTPTVVLSPTTTTVYTVTGTTGSCISNNVTSTITVNATPTLSISGTQTICLGQTTTLSASGASSYTWSTGATTPSISVSPSSTTTYSIIGTSVNGCIGIGATGTVTVNSGPAISVDGTHGICLGQSATLTASGATSYTWSTGASTASINVSPASTTVYTVAGIGTNGCVGSAINDTLILYNSPSISISGTHIICAGQTITLTASGAGTYTWSTGANGTLIQVSPTTTTVYSVTGTSQYGCIGNGVSDTITVNADPSSIIISGTQTVCSGQTTTLTASGATSYTWSTGANTASINVSPSTTTVYTVTGANTSGCIASTTSTVTVNSAPLITVSGINALCTIATTTLTASGAVTYSWSTGATTAAVIVSPVTTTVYTVTGTTASGCTNTATTTVSVNQGLPLSINGGGAQTICSGHAITLTASGANTYTWNTGATTNSISVNPTTTTVYTVRGTNTGGCAGITTVTVTVNPTPTVALTGDQTICTGQTITLTATGATTYVWSTGATTSSIAISPTTTTVYTVTGTTNGCSQSVANTVPVNITPTVTVGGNTAICSSPSTTLTASGASTYSWSNGATTASVVLSPTTTTVYTVTGTSISGCKNSVTSTVSVNQSLPININGSQAICSGQTTTLTATGANSYTWSTGSTTPSITVNPTSTTIYTVSGTNVDGCIGTASSTVTVNSSLSLSISGTQTVCSNQTTTLTASGATSYTWSTGATTASVIVNPSTTTIYTVNGVDGVCKGIANATVTVNQAPNLAVNGILAICSIPTTTLTATGASTYTWNTGATSASVVLSPTVTTTYTVSGSNPNGCQSSITTTVTVDQNLSLVIGGPKTICLGETATLTASGANTYTWNTGSHNASIVVTPSVTTIYTLTASNAGGCSGIIIDTIIVAPLPTLNISGNQNLCPGQTTTLTASGASTYTWNTGATTSSIVVSPSSTTIYSVTGINSTGCKAVITATVSLTNGPVVSVGGSPTICFGESATLTASGASTYTWNTGAITSVITVNPSSTKTYTVTGTSSSGCKGPGTAYTVTVNPTPTVTINGGQSICQGQSTTLNASGANTYTWSSGEIASSVTKNPSSTTSYTVTGTNSIGCSNSVSVTVIVIQTPTITIAGGQTICAGETTTLTASGANSYNWSTNASILSTQTQISPTTGAITSSIQVDPTVTTTYTVVGSNGGSCTSSGNVVVTVNQGPTIGVIGIQSICSGQTTTLTATGADSYTWNPGGIISSTIAVSPTVTTLYQITGSVSTGVCTNGFQDVAVIVTPSPVIQLTPTVTVCSGSVYQINASVSNGTYTWTPTLSGLTPIISTTSQTSYTLSASNGSCQASENITIVPTTTCAPPPCTNCLGTFSPEPGKKYLFTAWVKEESAVPTTTTYSNSKVYIEFPNLGPSNTVGPFSPAGSIIDGWQRIESVFFIPVNATNIEVHLQSTSGNSYYDDVRVFPFDGSVKSYVYDPVSRRLVAELDERNYATLYEYDEEGKLLRIKKETERGVMTIQESKSKSKKQ